LIKTTTAGSFALPVRYCPTSSSWKTHHCLWEEDLPASSVILPRWGMMRDGECWALTMPALPMRENGSGWLPTPLASDARKCPSDSLPRVIQGLRGSFRKRPWVPTPIASDGKGSVSLERAQSRAETSKRGVRLPEFLSRVLGQSVGTKMHPECSEWLMAWPIGWTDLKPLEMAKFQQWLDSHGKPSHLANP
jgi:hypothetical protein